METIENGEHLTSTVPMNWIINGVLYWPSTKNHLKIKNLKITKAAPLTNWLTLPCEIKRGPFLNLIDAEKAEAVMSGYSETDEEPITHRLQLTRMEIQHRQWV